MSELATGFWSLPEEYQLVIRVAEQTHKITVAPLQLLVGGWSGAVVYLVSVSNNDTKRVEHCILKLDRKAKSAKSDEVSRHNTVMTKSTAEFARDHIAELVFDRVEHDGAIAIFYRIAGQSLLKYRPLSRYERQSQLRTIFTETDRVLLTEWNSAPVLEPFIRKRVLQKWLGFRLDSGGNIERFVQDTCHVNPDTARFTRQRTRVPQSLELCAQGPNNGAGSVHRYCQRISPWRLEHQQYSGQVCRGQGTLEGYYLIDFALFKERMPLFYDQRYLEMSYLLHAMSRISFAKCSDFLTSLAVADIPDPHKVPIEMSGVCAVIGAARKAFGSWVQDNHPSLHDDLWGQYWLAGVASGLGYCHKLGMSDEQRLAGLIYAAANLKRYAAAFSLPATKMSSRSTMRTRPTQISTAHGHRSTTSPPSPLPSSAGSPELTAVEDLLIRGQQYVRLVTLTGPGGTGKTRLASRLRPSSSIASGTASILLTLHPFASLNLC